MEAFSAKIHRSREPMGNHETAPHRSENQWTPPHSIWGLAIRFPASHPAEARAVCRCTRWRRRRLSDRAAAGRLSSACFQRKNGWEMRPGVFRFYAAAPFFSGSGSFAFVAPAHALIRRIPGISHGRRGHLNALQGAHSLFLFQMPAGFHAAMDALLPGFVHVIAPFCGFSRRGSRDQRRGRPAGRMRRFPIFYADQSKEAFSPRPPSKKAICGTVFLN